MSPLPILFVWSPISPGVALAVLVALSGVAAVVEAVSRSRRRKWLRQLAAKWQMTYSAFDRLKVTSKIARHFPVPGAADLFVRDVIYGGQGEQYRYIFTVEFTVGVIRGKRRQVRAASFVESRDRRPLAVNSPISFGPENVPIRRQYEELAVSRLAVPEQADSRDEAP